MPEALLRVASPGYFDAMRLRLVGGRLFTRRDGTGAPRVLVVNESFAREVLGGVPAVGRRVRFAGAGSIYSGGDDVPWEIIGIVADVMYDALSATRTEAEAYAPVRQIDAAPTFEHGFPMVVVRTSGDPLAAVPFIREAVAEARPGASVATVATMDARLSSVVAQPRFYAVVVGGFAALAILLSGFGVYGLLSYTVAQRRGEIAIRMARGARRRDILALVVRQGAALVAAGAAVGLAAAASSSRVLDSFIYGIATDDLLTFVAAPLAAGGRGALRVLRPGAPRDPGSNRWRSCASSNPGTGADAGGGSPGRLREGARSARTLSFGAGRRASWRRGPR